MVSHGQILFIQALIKEGLATQDYNYNATNQLNIYTALK